MRTRSALLLAVAAGLALLATACTTSDSGGGRGEGTGGVTGTITVSAAASLTAPLTTIAQDFMAANPGTRVELNLDSSGTLTRQILAGAPADVFASADEANMAELVEAGLIAGDPQDFARNQLAIVVKAGNPGHVRSLADLAGAGTISLCGLEAPCGGYAQQILAREGVTIPADRITRGQNVKATLAAVAEGDADAGIVYATDITGDTVTAVPIPAPSNVVATYPIGVLDAAVDPAAAEAFVAFVLSERGQAPLTAAGFLAPAST